MKQLIIIIAVLVSFTSCTKEVSEQSRPQEEIATRTSRNLFNHVGVRTGWPPFFIPSFKGIAFEAKVVDLKMQGDYTKSVWESFHYRVLVDGVWRRRWLQLGWFNESEFAFYIYDRTFGDAQIVPTIRWVDQNVTTQKGVVTRFEVKNIKETTWWSISLNGKVRFDVDLGTEVAGDFPNEISSNNAIELFTETRGGDTFSSVIHVNYLEYYKDGVWVKAPSARSSGSGWKVVGYYQNNSFQKSEFEIGGRGYIESETPLW